MSDSDMLPFGAAVAADVLSAFSLPGGSTLTALAGAYLAKRRREATNILIEEIASGRHGEIRFDDHDIDPLIEMIMRFSKVVADGAARENLILLAQVIAGMKKNKALDSDKFRKWCSILENLNRDQLICIGRAYIIMKRIEAASTDTDVAASTDTDEAASTDTFSNTLRNELATGGYQGGEIEALCASVSRTGLLTPVSAYSGMAYHPTPWLKELGELADIDKVSQAARPRRSRGPKGSRPQIIDGPQREGHMASHIARRTFLARRRSGVAALPCRTIAWSIGSRCRPGSNA
jgi:hypothetical protein